MAQHQNILIQLWQNNAQKLNATGLVILTLLVFQKLPIFGLQLSSIGVEPRQLSLSVLSIGFVPWLTICSVGEILALLFSSYSWMKKSMSLGHINPYSRPIVFLSILLALYQSYHFIGTLSEVSYFADSFSNLILWTNVTALVAGSALIIWLGACLEKFGFGMGFWTVLTVYGLTALSQSAALDIDLLQKQTSSTRDYVVWIVPAIIEILVVTAIVIMRARSHMKSVNLLLWPFLTASICSNILFSLVFALISTGRLLLDHDKVYLLANLASNLITILLLFVYLRRESFNMLSWSTLLAFSIILFVPTFYPSFMVAETSIIVLAFAVTNVLQQFIAIKKTQGLKNFLRKNSS